MITVVDALTPAVRSGVDQIIDVRSPSEFAEDHVPGSTNLPVLDDAERARIGTIYVQDDPFRARRLGAALVARNVAAHLETAFADKDGRWRPLVYCWRGGQRSHAMAAVLSQVGWRTSVLDGGYRTYRRGVVAMLYAAPPLDKVVVLDGGTGAGKTQVLRHLADAGLQTLDLEDLAEHRGSVFGATPGRPQPSQKMFESRLAARLQALDRSRPVVVEAESSKIGERVTPPALWAAMSAASRVVLEAPVQVRAARLAETYAGTAQDRAAVSEALARLPRHIGRTEIDGWRARLAAGDLRAVAGDLLDRHYDPAYARAAQQRPRPTLGSVSTQDLSPAGLARVADQIAALIEPARA